MSLFILMKLNAITKKNFDRHKLSELKAVD